MSDMEEHIYSVSIETWGDGPGSVDADTVSELSSVLESVGEARGASTSVGGLAGGVGATFAVEVSPDWTQPEAIRFLAERAVSWFDLACEKLGLAHHGIARVDIMSEAYLERNLSREPETYLGVSETAETLNVSRQRVSELRARSDFPAPIAEIAAGPVWAGSSLKRFLASWDRKPGRPRRNRDLESYCVRAEIDFEAYSLSPKRQGDFEREVLASLRHSRGAPDIAWAKEHLATVCFWLEAATPEDALASAERLLEHKARFGGHLASREIRVEIVQ